jgi:uncharacterized protein (DUF2062 family)
MKRHLQIRLRRFKRRARYFIFHSVLHADDPPHRLALGIAIGVFVTFTPTVGFQMLLAVVLAWILRANKVVGIPIVWITNPITIVPVYYTCYRIGRLILGQPGVGWRWWAELARGPDGWWAGIHFYWQRFMQIATPLWFGCLVVAILSAYTSYYVSYNAIYGYRMRRWGQLMPPPSVLRRRRKKKPRGS